NNADGFTSETGFKIRLSDPVAEFPRTELILPACRGEFLTFIRATVKAIMDFLHPSIRLLQNTTALEVLNNGRMATDILNIVNGVMGFGRCNSPLTNLSLTGIHLFR